MAMPVPTQYVLYVNDGVDVSYSDGSRLVLSPCGASFQHHKAVPDVHPAFRNSRAENRSQFATQEVRPCLIDALDFRNRFAERPFLCKDLLDTRQIIRLHADIQEIAWPKIVNGEVQTLRDGSVRLVSEDEYAVITLGANRKHATVEYLAKVSQRVSRRSLESPHQRQVGQPDTTSTSRCDKIGDKNSSVLNNSANDSSDLHENAKWDYAWTVLYYSVQNCPANWRAPLDLIMKYLESLNVCTSAGDSTCVIKNVTKDKAQENVFESHEYFNTSSKDETSLQDTSNYNREVQCPSQHSRSMKKLLKKDFSGCIFTTVPKTLPLNCCAQHMHKWDNDVLPSNSNGTAEAAYIQGRVKVICVQGVIYRLLWSGSRGIEIYPGDGTVIVSCSLSGKFFTHYIPNNGKVTDRMYSAESLPPTSPNFSYSVNKLVTRALRFLQLVQAENFQLVSQNDNFCWKQNEKQFIHSPNQIPSTKILEENVVGGVGTFQAYTNGQIHIKFLDRTILDMAFNYDQKTTGTEPIHAKLMALRQTLNLKQGMCRLLLPSGHYQYVSIDDPGPYEKYVKAAIAWRKWVTTDADERQKEIDEKQDNTRRVYQELKKIECFNFLLENRLLAKFAPLIAATQSKHGHYGSRADFLSYTEKPSDVDDLSLKFKTASLEPNDSCISQEMINDILKRTSAAVADIGTFLKSNGELKPVRD